MPTTLNSIIEQCCGGTATDLTVEIVVVLSRFTNGRATLKALCARIPDHTAPAIRCHLQRHCKYRAQSWVESKGWADVFRREGNGVWALRPELVKRLQFDASH